MCHQIFRETIQVCRQIFRETIQMCRQIFRETIQMCQQIFRETIQMCQQILRESIQMCWQFSHHIIWYEQESNPLNWRNETYISAYRMLYMLLLKFLFPKNCYVQNKVLKNQHFCSAPPFLCCRFGRKQHQNSIIGSELVKIKQLLLPFLQVTIPGICSVIHKNPVPLKL